jgi:hypothetical protein
MCGTTGAMIVLAIAAVVNAKNIGTAMLRPFFDQSYKRGMIQYS